MNVEAVYLSLNGTKTCVKANKDVDKWKTRANDVQQRIKTQSNVYKNVKKVE
jgi:hypothetical protein